MSRQFFERLHVTACHALHRVSTRRSHWLAYAVPQTAILGAVLLTGYLGGAVATHVRVGDLGFVVPLLLGLSACAGIFLREERLRALLPIRKRRM